MIMADLKKIIDKTLKEVSLQTAPSGPAAPSAQPVQPLAEPILFEKDGWGIYTQHPDDLEGSCLTHIGCDCDFPFWSVGHSITFMSDPFTYYQCTECQEFLHQDTYLTLVRVYKFINGLESRDNEWHIR